MENMQYVLRIYDDSDYEFIYKTKKDVYIKYVEENYGKWDENIQRQLFKKFIKEYKNEIQIIIIDSKRIGFVHGRNIDRNTYELGNICIIKEFQGKGIGTLILENVIKENEGKEIQLRCFKQNPAQELYKRLGFKVFDKTNHHIKMVLTKKR